MDELKLLIEMVANLPQTALWVCIGFFAYKVIVIGSIYSVIRFCVQKMYDAYKKPQTYTLNGIKVDNKTALAITSLICRLCTDSRFDYIRPDDVVRLQKAVDIVIEEKTK